MKFFLTTQPPSHRRFPLRLPRSERRVCACVCAPVCVRVYFRLVFPFVFRLSSSVAAFQPYLVGGILPSAAALASGGGGGGRDGTERGKGRKFGFSPAQISFSR